MIARNALPKEAEEVDEVKEAKDWGTAAVGTARHLSAAFHQGSRAIFFAPIVLEAFPWLV
jgi:hypothetical protein